MTRRPGTPPPVSPHRPCTRTAHPVAPLTPHRGAPDHPQARKTSQASKPPAQPPNTPPRTPGTALPRIPATTATPNAATATTLIPAPRIGQSPQDPIEPLPLHRPRSQSVTASLATVPRSRPNPQNLGVPHRGGGAESIGRSNAASGGCCQWRRRGRMRCGRSSWSWCVVGRRCRRPRRGRRVVGDGEVVVASIGACGSVDRSRAGLVGCRARRRRVPGWTGAGGPRRRRPLTSEDRAVIAVWLRRASYAADRCGDRAGQVGGVAGGHPQPWPGRLLLGAGGPPRRPRAPPPPQGVQAGRRPRRCVAGSRPGWTRAGPRA